MEFDEKLYVRCVHQKYTLDLSKKLYTLDRLNVHNCVNSTEKSVY